MQRDYYAFKQGRLSGTLNDLERAAEAFAKAKQQRNRDARDHAERQMKQAAAQAAVIEPHVAHLWFDACDSDLNNSVRDAWQERLTAGSIPRTFRFTPESSAITHLPPLSWTLSIPFRLQKPYLSKDERDFHVLDNPVRKEKVFQTPMVASTGWKGALRGAFWQLGYKEEHEVTIRLLGNPRESEEQQAGRLHFFSTFFEQIGLEVITPHDRSKGIPARGPILMECVPQGTKGELVLLYVPFGPFEQDEDQKCTEVAKDLRMVAKGIQATLTIYGFGAKTSSGFGTADDHLAGEGKLSIRAELAGETAPPATPPEPQPPNLPRYLESPTRLHADLRRPDGSPKSEAEYQALVESRGQKYAKRDKQLYAKAKGWWEREGQAMAEAASQEPEPEPEPPATPPVTDCTFRTLSELCELAEQVAAQLQGGGEA